jgi:hypothetical protein
MTPPESLARAVERCGYRCLECQSPVVVLHWAPALGWIPTIRHWQVGGKWCPALAGGEVAALESLDLLDALAAAVAVADYGEPVWHARGRPADGRRGASADTDRGRGATDR